MDNNVKKINSTSFYDSRGSLNHYNLSKNLKFKIDNILFTKNLKKGTLRGIHFQSKPYFQKKIIKVVSGKIFDVVVNINKKSKKYGKKKYFELSSKEDSMLYIGTDYAHAFQTLEKNTTILYIINGIYKSSYAKTINYDDKFLKIKWPLSISSISYNDKKGISFFKL